MKVLVINGSPKGKYSCTLQTSLYLEKLFPECEYTVLHCAQQIRKYEKDINLLIDEINKTDLVVFSYPVYTFLCPSQLHKIIYHLKQHNCNFKGKFCTQISTSKHFYDATAHKYIEENALDLGFSFIKGICADMDDLTTDKGQKEAEDFWKYILHCVKNNIAEQPVVREFAAIPDFTASADTTEKKNTYDTVIVTDAEESDTNLLQMIEEFKAVYPYPVRVVNMREFPFDGGCLGCFKCAVSEKCVYKDGFDEYLRKTVQSADAFVYAFRIKDHSPGPVFKTFNDRQFCNGHRTVTMGKPIGYLISGNYLDEQNVRTVVEARSQVGGNFFCGAASDDNAPAEGIAAMAKRLSYAVETGYTQPADFYGVGGMKIFRDLIYVMRGLMKADHKFYKKHGFYDDLPTKQKGRMIAMTLVGNLMAMPSVQSKAAGYMNEGMLMPYKKAMEKAEKRANEKK